jgi:hypothetical protein
MRKIGLGQGLYLPGAFRPSANTARFASGRLEDER